MGDGEGSARMVDETSTASSDLEAKGETREGMGSGPVGSNRIDLGEVEGGNEAGSDNDTLKTYGHLDSIHQVLTALNINPEDRIKSKGHGTCAPFSVLAAAGASEHSYTRHSSEAEKIANPTTTDLENEGIIRVAMQDHRRSWGARSSK
jgi:hypothetical protein